MLAAVFMCAAVGRESELYYYSRFMKKLELEKDAQIEEQCRKRWEDKRPNERTTRSNEIHWRLRQSRCVVLFGVVLAVGWVEYQTMWRKNTTRSRAQQIKPINEKIQGVFELYDAVWKYHRLNPKESKFCVWAFRLLCHGMKCIHVKSVDARRGAVKQKKVEPRCNIKCISSDNDSKSEKLITDVNACVHKQNKPMATWS